MIKPKPVAYNIEDGGQWALWGSYKTRSVFAVLFDDGSIFDVFIGWRSSDTERLKAVMAHLNEPKAA
jgi:hypothetical protein